MERGWLFSIAALVAAGCGSAPELRVSAEQQSEVVQIRLDGTPGGHATVLGRTVDLDARSGFGLVQLPATQLPPGTSAIEAILDDGRTRASTSVTVDHQLALRVIGCTEAEGDVPPVSIDEQHGCAVDERGRVTLQLRPGAGTTLRVADTRLEVTTDDVVELTAPIVGALASLPLASLEGRGRGPQTFSLVVSLDVPAQSSTVERALTLTTNVRLKELVRGVLEGVARGEARFPEAPAARAGVGVAFISPSVADAIVVGDAEGAILGELERFSLTEWSTRDAGQCGPYRDVATGRDTGVLPHVVRDATVVVRDRQGQEVARQAFAAGEGCPTLMTTWDATQVTTTPDMAAIEAWIRAR